MSIFNKTSIIEAINTFQGWNRQHTISEDHIIWSMQRGGIPIEVRDRLVTDIDFLLFLDGNDNYTMTVFLTEANHMLVCKFVKDFKTTNRVIALGKMKEYEQYFSTHIYSELSKIK